jgi:hypothetical protein
MQAYGIPAEVLSDNGKQFTGRFGKPRPAEVLFERIERLHQTLQDELLTVHPPFGTIADAQAAVDAWRQEYNATRPHQSLNMAFPVTRFAPRSGEVLALRIPSELRTAAAATAPAQPAGVPDSRVPAPAAALPPAAVEVSRIVPPSGNLWIAGQQIWLGPPLAGRTAGLWAGLDRVHVLLDGYRIKTLPSRLDRTDIARLLASGAKPAGQPPLPPASGLVNELERTVSASGNISVGNQLIGVGLPLAGQRITLRLDGPVAHIVADGMLVRTVACPIPAHARDRLRGARRGSASPPRLPSSQIVRRRVSVRGAIMVGGQRIQVGLPHARKTAEVTIEADTFQITIADALVMTAPRKTSRDIRRHKASNYRPAQGRSSEPAS